jgi:aminomethyltransferase
MDKEKSMKHTALTHVHQVLGAKMVPFAGYLMPLEYEGIMTEHQNVRQNCGIFDVSHMGNFWVKGKGAADFIQKMTTNDVYLLNRGKAQYSCIPNGKGGIVDDLIIYNYEAEKYMLVVNAANLEKDWNWLMQHKPDNVEMDNASDKMTILAIQGPKAVNAVQRLTESDVHALNSFEFFTTTVAGVKNVIISATGYTGAGGLELYLYNEGAEQIWQKLMDNKEQTKIMPVGLAARDTLRLEAGLCLYGNDLTDKTSTIEANLGWITKFNENNDFIDKEYLLKQKEEGVKRKLVGFEMIEKGIPRHGYPVVFQEKEIGYVTSGSMSPTLKTGIGLGYVATEYSKPGAEIFIRIRKKTLKAQVVKLPFLK